MPGAQENLEHGIYPGYPFSCIRFTFSIHQTWKTKTNLEPRMQASIDSWKQMNPTWEHRLYDDDDCLQFVKTNYPNFLKGYMALSKPVERADVFRYLVVYHYGGKTQKTMITVR